MTNKDKVWRALRCLTYREMMEIASELRDIASSQGMEVENALDWSGALAEAAHQNDPEEPTA